MASKKIKKEFVAVASPAAQRKLGTSEVEKIRPQSPVDNINVAIKREDTRANLAKLFIFGFFAVLIAVIILAGIAEGDKVTNMKETLITVSGILSGPLGFVIGYYFRSREEED